MAQALHDGLEADGYNVRVAHTGEEGFYLIQAQPFDLAILDVMLPGHDGIEILSTLRKRGVQTPVLLLTSRDAVEDRVRGLDAGADDYLVKPFAFFRASWRASACCCDEANPRPVSALNWRIWKWTCRSVLSSAGVTKSS